jgi:hypothetical protein
MVVAATPPTARQTSLTTTPTTLTIPTKPKPDNYGKPQPDHAKHLADLFGGISAPKKKKSTANRIGDIGNKVAKLEKEVAKNPHPYLVQSLADHKALLQSLKDLPLYIEE